MSLNSRSNPPPVRFTKTGKPPPSVRNAAFFRLLPSSCLLETFKPEQERGLFAGRFWLFRRSQLFERFDGMKGQEQNLRRKVMRLRFGVIHGPGNFILENLCDGPKQLAKKPADRRNIPEQLCFDS